VKTTAAHHIELVNSINFSHQGQKTAAMEVCDQLGDAPGACAAVGNAGNITAY
jgi:threonine synthase